MVGAFKHFASVWCIVVAAKVDSGEPIEPIALAVLDLAGTKIEQFGMPKLRSVRRPPYPTGPQTLLLTIDAHLFAGCHLALGWRMPERIVDVALECKNSRPATRQLVGGLPGLLADFGQPSTLGLVSGFAPDQMKRRLDVVVRLYNGLREKT